MAVIEAMQGLEFFLSRLRLDSQIATLSPGGVYQSAAPVGTVYPCSIVQFQSGIDVLTANAVRLMVNALYLVKGVGLANDSDSVTALASRIDDMFKRTQGATTGGYVLSCYRESLVQYPELDAGVEYMHLGGLYRIQNQSM